MELKNWSLYILVCLLGLCAITLRGGALHYAHRCATTAARATILTGAEQSQARDAARSAAWVSNAMNWVGILAILIGVRLWFVARRRQQAEPVLPAFLLLVYMLMHLVTI